MVMNGTLWVVKLVVAKVVDLVDWKELVMAAWLVVVMVDQMVSLE